MKPANKFLNQPKAFWANVRTVSEALGYTQRGKGQVRTYSLSDVEAVYRDAGLTTDHIVDSAGRTTEFGTDFMAYFSYRAQVLNEYVEPRLMNLEQAAALYAEMRKKLKPKCPVPMNRQKGDKKTIAYLTALVNMMVERYGGGPGCEFDPQKLTTVTNNNAPLRTLARRVDGAFPSVVNPIAIWEVKEYYHTTTFGSRVADGIYETLLDGMELEELREHEGVHVKHYLMVDAHYTWWRCGRSYLCRIVDMLHMGYVDEVFFGKEVVERLPEVVSEWVEQAKGR